MDGRPLLPRRRQQRGEGGRQQRSHPGAIHRRGEEDPRLHRRRRRPGDARAHRRRRAQGQRLLRADADQGREVRPDLPDGKGHTQLRQQERDHRPDGSDVGVGR